VQQWLNPAAFAQPPVATTVGQTDYSPLGGPIYAARGPVLDNTDASLFKNFSLPATLRLQLRAESFNVFNHPEFGQPSNTGGFLNYQPGNGFSQIYYTRNPNRILQLALKLYY
jgi:hypothetical protein